MTLDAGVSTAAAAGIPVLASLLLLIVILALCVCHKDKANQIHITPISLTLPNAISRESEINNLHSNGVLTPSNTNHTVEGLDGSKMKVLTLQRKLPDIPLLPIDGSIPSASATAIVDLQNLDGGSELYATVESSSDDRNKSSDRNVVDPKTTPVDDIKPASSMTTVAAPLLPPPPVPLETMPALLKTSAQKEMSRTLSSIDSDGNHQYSQVHHRYDKVKKENPYALVKGQTSEERDTDTDNYDEPQIYAQTGVAVPGRWQQVDNIYEPPPPVPEKHFDLREEGTSDHNILAQPSTSAANAMTGRVSASEIPYVTSPVDSPVHQIHQAAVNQRPVSQPVQEFVYNVSQESGSGQAIRYTSISVREPLANLRSNLDQPLRQNQQESYYMVVSDDELDQTYDEIREQVSGNGSVTYALVEAPGASTNTRELPPVPPPVESLRSLANVHSRQTSSSSTLSGHLGAASSDADSHYLSMYGSNTAISSAHSDASNDLYSTVIKPKAYNRRTIHVMDPQSIEEMYSKVLKNKHLSVGKDTSLAEMTLSSSSNNNNNSNVNFKPKVPPHPPTVPLPEVPPFVKENKREVNRRPKSMIAYSELPTVEPLDDFTLAASTSTRDMSPSDEKEYQDVGDVQLKRNKAVSQLPLNADPGYESVKELLQQAASSKLSDQDPGYERIREKELEERRDDFEPISLTEDPDYEVVLEARNHHGATQSSICTFPDYETVLEARTSHVIPPVNPIDHDPDYETINPNVFSDSVDPDYEEIRQQSRRRNGEVEPGYEQIRGLSSDQDSDAYGGSMAGSVHPSDPGYETIRYTSLNPGYERVRSPYDDGEDEFSDPSYEQVHFAGADGNMSEESSSKEERLLARESWESSFRHSGGALSDDNPLGIDTPPLREIESEDGNGKHNHVVQIQTDPHTEISNAGEGNNLNVDSLSSITEPPYAVVKKNRHKKRDPASPLPTEDHNPAFSSPLVWNNTHTISIKVPLASEPDRDNAQESNSRASLISLEST